LEDPIDAPNLFLNYDWACGVDGSDAIWGHGGARRPTFFGGELCPERM